MPGSGPRAIENIQPSLLLQVNPVNVHLVTATGETSPFIGQINVQISLGKKFYQHNVFIADISNKSNPFLFTNLSVCSTNPTRSLLIRSINWPLAIISVFGGT
jgi:hypothetical protein